MDNKSMLHQYVGLMTRKSPDEIFEGWTTNQLKTLFVDSHPESKFISFLKISVRESYDDLLTNEITDYVAENPITMYTYIITHEEVTRHTEKCTPFNVMHGAMIEKVQLLFVPQDKVAVQSGINRIVVGAKEKKATTYDIEIEKNESEFSSEPASVVTFVKDENKYESDIRRGCIAEPPDFKLPSFSPYDFQTMNCNASILFASLCKVSEKKIVPAVVKDNLNKFYGPTFFKKSVEIYSAGMNGAYGHAVDEAKIDNLTGSKLASLIYNYNTRLTLPVSSLIFNYSQRELFGITADSPGMVPLQYTDDLNGKQVPSKWYAQEETVDRLYRKFSPAVNPFMPVWRGLDGNILLNMQNLNVETNITVAYLALDIARTARLEGDKGFSDLTQGYVYGVYGMPRVMANAGYLFTNLQFFDFKKYDRILFWSDSKDSTHCIAEVAREHKHNIELISFGPSSTVDQTSRVINWGRRTIDYIVSVANAGDLIIHMGFENHRLGAIPSQEKDIERAVTSTYEEYTILSKSSSDVLMLGYVYEKPVLPKVFKVMVSSEPHNLRVLMFKGVSLTTKINFKETAHEPMEAQKCKQRIAKYSIIANYVRNLAFHVLDFHLILGAFSMKPVMYHRRLPNYVGYSKGLLLMDPTYDMPADILKLYTAQYEIEFEKSRVIKVEPVPGGGGGRGRGREGRGGRGPKLAGKEEWAKKGDALKEAFGKIVPPPSEKDLAANTKTL